MTRAALSARSRVCNDLRLASAPLAVPIVPRRRGAARAMDDQLSRYRQSIDNIDAALVYMLAERFKVTKAVGELKATIDVPPADPGREARQIERLRRLAREANLDPEVSEKFLRFIIDEVIGHHSSEEHTSELQSLMRISYDGFSMKKNSIIEHNRKTQHKNQL